MRWDRLSRIAMLIVLLVIVWLYFGALRSFVSTYHEAHRRQAQVTQLQRSNAALRARRGALHSPAAIEREARRLGMVRPGERSYVIQGLPGH